MRVCLCTHAPVLRPASDNRCICNPAFASLPWHIWISGIPTPTRTRSLGPCRRRTPQPGAAPMPCVRSAPAQVVAGVGRGGPGLTPRLHFWEKGKIEFSNSGNSVGNRRRGRGGRAFEHLTLQGAKRRSESGPPADCGFGVGAGASAGVPGAPVLEPAPPFALRALVGAAKIKRAVRALSSAQTLTPGSNCY